jgi:ketosteroid isomerase-like protein
MAQTSDSTEQQRSRAAIEALRNQFEAALISGEPDDHARLITDDFVYYQPNFEGPCTYGKRAHLNYLRSLPKVHKVEIKLFDSILMSRWAFETGEEHYEESTVEGGRVHQVARFVRLLYRSDQGAWQMARTARGMALDLHCARQPPSPALISNGGRGHWQPMQVDIDAVNETEWLVAADQELMRRMLCDMDAGPLSLVSSVAMTPGHRFVSTTGNYTWKEYEDFQKTNITKNALDDLQRHNEDARVIVPGEWAYSMGRGIVTGILNRDGEAVRHGGVHLYFYLWQRIDKGRDPWPWKIRSSFACDMLNPFGLMDPENPLRSDVAHRYLEKQRREGVRPPPNKYAYLNTAK